MKQGMSLPGQQPRCLALFQPRIEGDEALLELASCRFREAGIGPEYYAASPDELAWLLRFKPWPEAATTVHLARDIDPLKPEGSDRIFAFAKRFSQEVFGFIIHDRPEMAERSKAYLAALTKINDRLAALPGKPLLFIEYTAGLSPNFFCSFIEGLADLDQVSACLDIGHLGIKVIRTAFHKVYPDHDLRTFNPNDPRLPDYIEVMEKCVRHARPSVIKVITRLGKLNKPLHFHLHDGHPLSTLSPFGVSDHLSFFQTIPLPIIHKGKKITGPMFGPKGLQAIIKKTLEINRPALLSFTLEIHPTQERATLIEESQLFHHWQDKTNAERQNHWLTTLIQNHKLLQKSITAAGQTTSKKNSPIVQPVLASKKQIGKAT
ncbi:MAG: hypothetical protein KKB30_15525 [Proteobacteria bacterium]|nr:hypothetical protein [Pseudomonadota bacterium]MBU1714432.1 hypothetical protein [Pseudomonadota bacterium]